MSEVAQSSRRVVANPPRNWKDHALAQLFFVRVREFIREPEAMFWGLIFPILLSVGLGVAFRNQPPEVVKVAAVTPQLVAALKQEKLLDVALLSSQDAREALRVGKVVLVAEPQAGTADQAGKVLYRYDDTNPDARNARRIADAAVQRAAGRADPVTVADDVSREPGARYIDFLVPGLVGMGIMGNAIWGMGFSIVDARRRKLMKRIVATPMPRYYYLLSFLIWRMVLLPVEVGVPVGFGALVFGVPMRGRLLDTVALCVLGSMSFSGLGLLISSRVKTIEAVSGLMNVIMMPMWILSGVFFSSSRFPDVVQPFVKALPLTALNDALRANMLQGVGLAQLVPQAAVLGGWALICFVVALKIFRWR